MHTLSVRHVRGLVLALVVTLAVWEGGHVGPIQAQSRSEPAPSAEHHIHLQSPEMTRIADAAQRAMGGSPKDAPPVSAPTAADAVEALDFAGVHYGLAISGAYGWGSPFLRSPLLTSILDSLGIEIGDERARVREENLYLAEQIARFPDRLVGACSVNPLKEYAREEVRLCGADPRIRAMKLHLANSGVDFRNPDHVARLQAFFQALEQTDLITLVHLRNRGEGYGAGDAGIFIREVLAAAPSVPVQIAHMAGWGEYDEETHAAMQAFVDAFEDGTLERDRFSFELLVVLDDPAEAGGDTAKVRQIAEQNARLAERVREVGVERVVIGTDWPFMPPVGEPRTRIARYRDQLRRLLPLEQEEFDRISSNVGPMFRR